MAVSDVAPGAKDTLATEIDSDVVTPSRRWLGMPPSAWAILVPLVILALTAMYYSISRADREREAQVRFDLRVAEIENAISDRMDAYTEVLRGGLGLFNASETVTRAEWRAYINALDIDNVLPGIQGIGFAEFVRPEDKANYEQSIRDEGFPDFRIRPEGDRPLYSSITFLEPFDERNRQAFGFDMYQQETRRAAMDLARNSGEVAISGRVVLVQEITEDVQAGFLMYLPFFLDGRDPESVDACRREIAGYVYSPFRMGNLMSGILGVGLPDVRLEVFDGRMSSPDTLMYDSRQRDDEPWEPALTAVREINVGQRVWTLRICSLRPFEAVSSRDAEYLIIASGIIVSLLLFFILRAFATTRERAQALAESMTRQLQENARELERSNAELELFAYVASHDLKAPLRGIDHLANWIESDLGDSLQGEPKSNMALLRDRVKRLEKLLDDLLGYSRAGRIEAPFEDVDLETTSTEWFKALNADGRFNLHQDIRLKTMRVRPVALEQVLTNLYSNSMKHHGSDEGNIYIRAFETDDSYEIHYEDDGPGIPTNQRERAFQMFQTLQPRDKVEGSGMGMAIIKKIIERDGGSVTCEDRPGGERGVYFRMICKKAGA